jgi:hypothetical protein
MDWCAKLFRFQPEQNCQRLFASHPEIRLDQALKKSQSRFACCRRATAQRSLAVDEQEGLKKLAIPVCLPEAGNRAAKPRGG